jgi:hypothetical protein
MLIWLGDLVEQSKIKYEIVLLKCQAGRAGHSSIQSKISSSFTPYAPSYYHNASENVIFI